MKTLHLLIIVIIGTLVTINASFVYGVHPLPVRVLFMESNTVGHLYIKFSTNYQSQTIKLSPMDIYDANLTNSNPLNLSALSIIPNQTSITIGFNSTVVDYTVTAKNNLKGIYALPLEQCGLVPFIIGLDSSQINENILDKFVTAKYNCSASPPRVTTELVSSESISPLPGTIASGVVPIQLRPDKEFYFPGDLVLIKGQVYTNDTKATIGLEKNHKFIVSSKEIPVSKNGTFVSNFTIPIDSDAKNWSLVVTTEATGGLIQDLSFIPTPLPPLKQFKSGISAENITCKQSFQLIMKIEDGSPACVKPSSINKLVLLHWALKPVNELTFEGFKDTYKVGEKIDFAFKFKGLFVCGSPSFIVKNTENKTIWESPIVLTLCDSDTGYGESKWKFGELYSLSINQTGSYKMNMSFSDKTVEKEFFVIQ